MNGESAYELQYSRTVYTLAQQQGSKLLPLVSREDLRGEKKFFETVGPTTVRRRTGKFEDSPVIETPFGRRAIIPHDYDWGDFCDPFDEMRMTIDPKMPVVQAGRSAMGRAIDDEIIEAIFGLGWEGDDGRNPVPLPTSQVCPPTVGGTSGNTGLTLGKLKWIRKRFRQSEIDLDVPGNEIYMAISAAQHDDLLGIVQISSSEYNSTKVLVDGEVRKFLGINFVQVERLKVGAGDLRQCGAWIKSGVAVAMPKDITATMGPRADKSNAWYAYLCMSVAAARKEETKVIEVPCLEA